MKKKLALATAIATLMTGLSMFSSVLASAEWQGNELIVIDANTTNGYILVAVPEQRSTSRRDMLCGFYTIGAKSTEFAPIAEQVKYGDIIRCSGEGDVVCTCILGINSMSFEFGEGILEIVGSVLDTSLKNIDSVTVDDQTFVQITGADGTRYVFEDGADCDEVEGFLNWEYDGCYTGFELFHEEDAEYSEELANRYNKESGHPIWIRPNEDGDVNSDDKIDSADASVILEEIALYGVGDTGKMNMSESQAADVNGDGVINAEDAAIILSYSSEVGSGMLEGVSLKAYASR